MATTKESRLLDSFYGAHTDSLVDRVVNAYLREIRLGVKYDSLKSFLRFYHGEFRECLKTLQKEHDKIREKLFESDSTILAELDVDYIRIQKNTLKLFIVRFFQFHNLSACDAFLWDWCGREIHMFRHEIYSVQFEYDKEFENVSDEERCEALPIISCKCENNRCKCKCICTKSCNCSGSKPGFEMSCDCNCGSIFHRWDGSYRPIYIATGKLQMEGIVGSVIEGVKGLAITEAKKLVKSFCDNPSIKELDWGDVGVTNLPRKVTNLGVAVEDDVGDLAAVVSESGEEAEKNMYLLNRFKIPSRLIVATWSESNTSGNVLFQSCVTPNYCVTTTTGGFVYYNHTILSAFSQMYDLWRGGLRYTVECLPTRFHQGQLYVAFNPNAAGTSLSLATNCTCATIDLGINNRTSLDIPFVAQADYLHNNQTPVQSPATDVTQSLGTFTVYVQNPLISNGTVATSIEVNIYVEALDDFEMKVLKRLPTFIQYYQNGVWQMENATTTRVSSHESEPPSKLSNTKDENVAVCLNVETALTENIMGRRYLIDTGITWSTSQGIGSSLTFVDLPSAFLNGQIATNGLSDYHELMRMDFKVTVRINPTQFHQGAMLIYFTPMNIDLSQSSLNTYMQFPHTFLNVAAETMATLVVPYSTYVRFLRVGQDFGNVHMIVWNTLSAPTSAPTTLTFSTWVEANNAHIAVKKQVDEFFVRGRLQMDQISDMGADRMSGHVAFKQTVQSKPGYIRGNHMDVRTLLRRFDVMGVGVYPPSQTNALTNVWQVPIFGGRTHCFLSATYAFTTGANRIMIGSTYGRAVNVMHMAYVEWESSVKQAPTSSVSGFATFGTYDQIFNGGVAYSPAKEQWKVVEIPYYRFYPLVPTPQYNGAYVPTPTPGWPTLVVNYESPDSTGDQRTYLLHAVGDDFKLYFPVAIGLTRVAVTDLERLQSKLLQANPYMHYHEDLIIRSGDVELNPGPVDGRLQMLGNIIPEVLVQKATNTCEELSSVASELKSFVSDAKNLGALSKITMAADGVQKLASTADEGISRFKKTVSEVLTFGGESTDCTMRILNHIVNAVQRVLDMAVHLITVIRGGPLALASIASLTITLGRYIDLSVLSELKNGLTSRLKGVGIMQSDSTLKLIFNLCPSICKSVMQLWEYEMGDDETQCLSFRIKENLKDKNNPVDMVFAACEAILEYIFEGTGFARDWFACSDSQVIKFSAEVAAARGSNEFNPLTMKYAATEKKLTRLVRTAKKIKTYGTQVPRISPTLINDANWILDLGRLRNKGDSTRCPPIGVALVGDTSVGKSYLASMVIPIVLLGKLGMVGKSEDAIHEVWTMPNGEDTKFYDGYTQQKIVYIDDFLKDVKAGDAQDVINMISSSDFIVDMARLEDKGMKFRSDFIMVSSNMTNFSNVHGLAYAPALCARFAHAVAIEPGEIEMVLGDKKTARRLTGRECVQKFTDEVSRLTSMGPLKLDDFVRLVDRFWRFNLVDVSGGHRRGWISFRTFIDGIVADHLNKKKNHGSLMRGVEKIVFQMDDKSDNSSWFDSEESQIPSFAEYDDLQDINPFVMESIDALHDSIFDATSSAFADLTETELRDNHIEVMKAWFKSSGIQKGVSFDLNDAKAWKNVRAMPARRAAEWVYAAIDPPKRTPRWRGIVKWVLGSVLGLGATAIAAWGGYHLIKYVYKLLTSTVKGVLQNYVYDGSAPIKKKVRGNGVLQGFDEKSSRIIKNMRELRLVDIDEDVPLGRLHALMLQSKFILYPKHFYDAYLRWKSKGCNVIVQIRELDGTWRKILLEKSLTRNVLSDRCVVGFHTMLDLNVTYLAGSNINGCRDVMHFIPTMTEFSQNLCGQKKAYFMYPDGMGDCVIGSQDPIKFNDGEIEEHFYMLVGEMFDYKPVLGDCGLVYVLQNPKVSSPLVGMHSAKLFIGDETCGISPLVREWIKLAMDSIDITPVKVVVESLEPAHYANRFVTGVVQCLGPQEVNGVPLVCYTPTTDVHVRWHKCEAWPDEFLPSFKGKNEEVHALLTNAQKTRDHCQALVPQDIMQKCVSHYAQKFDKQGVVLTDEESYNGKEEMKALVLNTSAGILSKWFKGGKKELFDRLEDDSLVLSTRAKQEPIPLYRKTFAERLIEFECELERGVVKPCFWVATLKDELRKESKVKAGKTRVFEQPPLEFTIKFRKYFGDFANWVKSKPGFKTHSAIGIDVEVKWREFWRVLNLKGDKGFDLDYSNYDGSVCSQAFDFFRSITDEFYGEVGRQQRHSLLAILQYSHVITGNLVFFTTQGNKSGNPLTDVFNSMTNVWLIYVCYMHNHPSGPTLRDFDKNVSLLTYGDDVIISALGSVLKWFNRNSVASVANQLGYSVTSASKGDILLPIDTLSDLTFLKRKFVPMGVLVMAPLPQDVIYRELQWIKKDNRSEVDIQNQIIEGSVRFMAHHGPQQLRLYLEQLYQLGIKHLGFDFKSFYKDFLYEMYEKQS